MSEVLQEPGPGVDHRAPEPALYGEPIAPTEPELDERRVWPQILVASLSDHEAGELHGTWLDATAPVEHLEAGIERMLASSLERRESRRPVLAVSGAWGIYDHAGFGPLRLSDSESLELVQRTARGIVKHGEAFGAFAEWAGIAAATDESFKEQFLGEWDSREAYAAHLLLGLLSGDWATVQEWVRPYIQLDVEAFGRDLEVHGDIHTTSSPNGVWVFQGIKRDNSEIPIAQKSD